MRIGKRLYANRKPKGLRVRQPGDLVEVDGGSELQAAFGQNAGGKVSSYLFFHRGHLNSMAVWRELGGSKIKERR